MRRSICRISEGKDKKYKNKQKAGRINLTKDWLGVCPSGMSWHIPTQALAAVSQYLLWVGRHQLSSRNLWYKVKTQSNPYMILERKLDKWNSKWNFINRKQNWPGADTMASKHCMSNNASLKKRKKKKKKEAKNKTKQKTKN